MAIHDHVGPIRVALFLARAMLQLGYGSSLNLAPVDFGRVVGLYIATLFVIWQVTTFIAFGSLPTMPIYVVAHWSSLAAPCVRGVSRDQLSPTRTRSV